MSFYPSAKRPSMGPCAPIFEESPMAAFGWSRERQQFRIYTYKGFCAKAAGAGCAGCIFCFSTIRGFGARGGGGGGGGFLGSSQKNIFPPFFKKKRFSP